MNLHRILFLTGTSNVAAIWLSSMREIQAKYAITIAHPASTSTQAVRGFDLIMIEVETTTTEGALQLCKSLRRRTQAPILFVSAQADEEYEIKAYEAGADDYIVKPIGAELFQAKLQAWQRWIVPAIIWS